MEALRTERDHLASANKTTKERQKATRDKVEAELAEYKAAKIQEIEAELGPTRLIKLRLLKTIDELTPKVAELEKKATQASEEHRLILEDIEKATDELDKLGRQLERLMQEKLQTAADLDEAQTKGREIRSETSQLESVLQKRTATLTSLSESITQAEARLDDLQSDYETRRTALDEELKGILIQTSDAVQRLKQLNEQETQTRQAIAQERKALEKERESIQLQRAKVSTEEAKILKRSRLMRL